MQDCKIYESFQTIEKHPRIVVIGNFDGMHIGHQTLIEIGCKQGEKLNLPVMVLTFYPQYQSYINPKFSYIMSKTDKVQSLCDTGVDEILCIPCDSDFSAIPKEEFIRKILKEALLCEMVVIGFDFSFGLGGKGKPEDLVKAFGNERTVVLSPVRLGEVVVSSSVIKNALREGEVELVKTYLGRPYSITGKVVHGLKNGRKLLFPTANIELEKNRLIPARGVYIAEVILENGKRYPGVLNIGTRPTVVESGKELLEVHLLDFDGDLYGQDITVDFKCYLRPVKKYGSINELKEAIHQNILETRTYFQGI